MVTALKKIDLYLGSKIIIMLNNIFLLLSLACFTNAKLQTTSHIHKATDPDPPQPKQPQDMIIVISNYCNTTQTLSKNNYHLWEGTYVTPPPDTVAPENSRFFKYGFEIKAAASKRINGTVQYTSGENSVFVDFFAVPNEWGVAVSHSPSLSVEASSADVGAFSVYNIMVGHDGQDC